MKVIFPGLESSLKIEEGKPTVFEIWNHRLFSRVAKSLSSGLGSAAEEPFSIWEGDEELQPGKQFLTIANPLFLPWDDKTIGGALSSRMEELLLEDPDAREELEAFHCDSIKVVNRVVLQLNSDYGFEMNWDLKRFLKLFGFASDSGNDESLLDSLIRFLLLAKDVRYNGVLLFHNLKLFLNEKELETLYEQVFFTGLKVLLLETMADDHIFESERKYVIDLDLLEW